MSRSYLLAPLLVHLAMIGPLSAEPPRQHGIAEADAHRLALSTLLPFARILRQMRFDAMKASLNTTTFYAFQITAETGKAPDGDFRSPNLGFFAVNRFTGDVWDLPPCKRRSSPEILDLRRALTPRRPDSLRVFRQRRALAPCET